MPFYMTSIEFKARDDDHAKEVMKALRETLLDKTAPSENKRQLPSHIGYYKCLE